MKEQEDLLSVLLASGLGSRRKMAAAVMEGRVKVNGVEATNLRQPVDSQKDDITVDGESLRPHREELVYLVLNKPLDVLSTVSDDRGRRTVTEYIPGKYRRYRLYPAGRLDKDTTGLLLLTNDGEFTNKLTHPRFEHEKEYYAQLDRELTVEEIEHLETGVALTDGMTAPAKVSRVKGYQEPVYSVVIHEGRKRQVRRMFVHVGCQVANLKRIRLGKLLLGNLPEGEIREVPQRVVRKAFNIK